MDVNDDEDLILHGGGARDVSLMLVLTVHTCNYVVDLFSNRHLQFLQHYVFWQVVTESA
jgi:hypothetical protein